MSKKLIAFLKPINKFFDRVEFWFDGKWETINVAVVIIGALIFGFIAGMHYQAQIPIDLSGLQLEDIEFREE